MTNNADQYPLELISENDIISNEDISGNLDETPTESTSSSAEDRVTQRIITSTSSDAAVAKPWPGTNDANKINHNEVTVSMQEASPANESPSIDLEQEHCDSRISFVDENISSQQTIILSEDNLGKRKSLGKHFENGMGGNLDIGDESSSQNNPSYDVDNFCDDNSDSNHLNEIDDPKIGTDIQCASNDLKGGNDTPPNQEDCSWSFSEELPCEVRCGSNTDCLVHGVNNEGNENQALSPTNVLEKGHLTTKTLLCEEEISKVIPPLDLLPEESSEIINDARVGSDEIHEQKFTALLQKTQDGNGQSEVDCYPMAKRYEHDASKRDERENFKRRNSIDDMIKTRSKDNVLDDEEGTKKYADARDFWAPVSAVTSGQPIADKNNLGANEDGVSAESDSESSGIGSFETGDLDEGPFPFLSEKIEKKGARTKLTSVTMDGDSIMTCFSRDVSLGEPSSEGEDSNMMESSISRIVRSKAKKKRVKFCVDCGRRTAMILCATLVIYAFGTLLGSMSNAYWNFYQQTDDQQQESGGGGGGGEPP